MALPCQEYFFGYWVDSMKTVKNNFIMTSKKKKGFCKIELLLIVLILCTAVFLALPIVNTYLKSRSSDNIEVLDQNLPSWNEGIDENDSDVPVKIITED